MDLRRRGAKGGLGMVLRDVKGWIGEIWGGLGSYGVDWGDKGGLGSVLMDVKRWIRELRGGIQS